MSVVRGAADVGHGGVAAGLCDADVELLVQRIRVRVLRALRKLGKWVERVGSLSCSP